MPLLRVTLFKIPDAADVEKTLEAYEKLKANAQKVYMPLAEPDGYPLWTPTNT